MVVRKSRMVQDEAFMGSCRKKRMFQLFAINQKKASSFRSMGSMVGPSPPVFALWQPPFGGGSMENHGEMVCCFYLADRSPGCQMHPEVPENRDMTDPRVREGSGLPALAARNDHWLIVMLHAEGQNLWIFEGSKGNGFLSHPGIMTVPTLDHFLSRFVFHEKATTNIGRLGVDRR